MEKTYGMKKIRALMKLKDLDKSSPLSSSEIFNKCEEIIKNCQVEEK
jgi:hypothetical protein